MGLGAIWRTATDRRATGSSTTLWGAAVGTVTPRVREAFTFRVEVLAFFEFLDFFGFVAVLLVKISEIAGTSDIAEAVRTGVIEGITLAEVTAKNTLACLQRRFVRGCET